MSVTCIQQQIKPDDIQHVNHLRKVGCKKKRKSIMQNALVQKIMNFKTLINFVKKD